MATRLDIKNFLECTICLEQYNDPRTLRCTHDFCNECLENILVFDEDGSATITCPMRCSEVTKLGKEETLNSLATSITLTKMMKALNVEELKTNPSLPTCRYESKCRKEIVAHCCDMLMCEGCSNKHQSSKQPAEHVRTALLKFSAKRQKLNVMCAEHASKGLSVCEEDNKLLCVYCLKRNEKHVEHPKSCVDVEVTGLREMLQSNLEDKDADAVLRFRCLTEDEVLRGKEALNEVLRRRKEECLRRYQRYLERKEKLIRQEFEDAVENHMKKYPEPRSPYLVETLNKCDAELLLQKQGITQVIEESKRNTSSMKIETVSLSDSFDFRSQHPLGQLESSCSEDVMLTSQPVSTFRYHFKLHQNIRPRSLSIPPNYSPKSDGKRRSGVFSDSDSVHLEHLGRETSSVSGSEKSPPPLRNRPPPPPPPGTKKLRRSKSLPRLPSLQSLLSNLNQRVALPQRGVSRPRTSSKSAALPTASHSAGSNPFRARLEHIPQSPSLASKKRESNC